MFYSAELSFLQSVLEKYHVNTFMFSANEPLTEKIHFLFKNLNKNKKSGICFTDIFPDLKTNTIYKITDALFCNYYLFLLPEIPGNIILSIGPFMKTDISNEQILEQAENANLNAKELKSFERYIGSIPLIPDDSMLFAVVSAFAEKIWGSNKNYELIDITEDSFSPFSPFSLEKSDDSTEFDMKMMEQRYSFENELMDAVSHGLTHKVELMLTNFSETSFEKRSADPLRNIKNYCIIMNTLLRKAAENGGVHPLYIDSLSSSYAKKIEALTSVSFMGEFMVEIFKAYSNLVKNHSIKNYSHAVQKAIITIEADLTADLNLKSLAKKINVSSGYLSTVFKKETGQTLTDFVNNKRIKYAKHLLKTTNLQIQTVAGHCGILDVNYFSKLFKKHTGKTPKEYRKDTVFN